MKPSKSYIRWEIRNYLTTVPHATKQELVELNAWVQQGNSPYSNPFHIADEQGREMPFIHALRTGQELSEEADNNVIEPNA